MVKSLFKLALLTIPILVVIGLVRINFGTVLVPGDESFRGNYMAVVALTFMFSVSWLINIVIIRFYEKALVRYVISYLAMSLFIIALIFVTGKYVFADDKFLVHPFWVGLVFNTIIIGLSNFTILKTNKEKTELKLNELKRLQLEAEKKLLVQQLQPHFLFNALSTLKSLINEDQAKASDYTVQLSDFLRYTVASSKHDTVPVQSELDFTKDYIKLQSERFVDAVHSEIDMPNEVLEMRLPVLSLQTLVENAFKHNQFSVGNPLKIKIWFEDEMIKVSNTKNVSIPSADSTGTGLKNLDERYQIITSTSIIIEDKEDMFIVSLIPIVK